MNKKQIKSIAIIVVIITLVSSYFLYQRYERIQEAEKKLKEQRIKYEAEQQAKKHELEIINNHFKKTLDTAKFETLYPYEGTIYTSFSKNDDSYQETASLLVFCQVANIVKKDKDKKDDCREAQARLKDIKAFNGKKAAKAIQELVSKHIAELRKKYPELNQEDITWEPASHKERGDRDYYFRVKPTLPFQ